MIGHRVASRMITTAVAVICLSAGAESARADALSCIAASERELTLRKQGHLREALKQLALCADDACPSEVRTECAHRIDDVKSAIPSLILSVKDPAGNDVLGVTVTIDGFPVRRRQTERHWCSIRESTR